MKALGACIRCGGTVTFHERVLRSLAPLDLIDPKLAPHQVLGVPRLP